MKEKLAKFFDILLTKTIAVPKKVMANRILR